MQNIGTIAAKHIKENSMKYFKEIFEISSFFIFNQNARYSRSLFSFSVYFCFYLICLRRLLFCMIPAFRPEFTESILGIALPYMS